MVEPFLETQNTSGKQMADMNEEETVKAGTKACVDSDKATDVEDNTSVVTEEEKFKSPNNFAVPLSLSSQSKKGKSLEGKGKDSSTVKTSDQEKPLSLKDKVQQVPVNYKEPEWSGQTEDEYSFEVLKNGRIIDNISLKGKSYFVFGRLPSCDVTLEHPSLSRYHAVIQYSPSTTPTHERGWYVYDLDSTHGTWVNKRKVNPKAYYRIKVGHIVKFGGSSRLHILQGPDEDVEEESEMSITEMKELQEKQRKEAELLRQLESQKEEERAEKERKLLQDRGCSWGMGEDAEDVGDENPYASLTSENENLYIDDPKKALKGFYEREGIDLPDYQFTEVSAGSHKCRLEIPVDGPNGEELVAEAVVSGKKKDAVIACALEACRILDKLGMLRSSTHESRKRKQRNWEDNDYYDSDEDTFLDRTGTIEKKRTLRMKKAGKEAAETYESLMEKYNKVTESIEDIETKLEKAKAEKEALKSEEMDELEVYMMSIKSGVMDTKTRHHLKGELLRLKMEEQNLRRLVNIAKPASLPPLKPVTQKLSKKTSAAEILSRKLQLVQQQKLKEKKTSPVKHTVMDLKPDEYEEEEEDEDEKEKVNTPSEKTMGKKSQSCEIHKQKEGNSEKVGDAMPSKNGSSPQKVRPQPDTDVTQTDRPKSKKSSKFFSTSSALESMESQRPSSKHSKPKSQVDPDSLDPKFATWLPPAEQTGDGRTSLNDKFGY